MSKWSYLFSTAFVLVLTGCGTTVHPGQAGLRYTGWGDGLHKEVKNEGFYFAWPWNDVYVYDITWASRTEEVQVLTTESLHVPVRVTVTYRPKREELYRLATQLSPKYYEDVIQPAFQTSARAEFAKYAHNELGGKSPIIEQSIAGQLRNTMRDKPIEIGRVSVTHIQYDPNLTKAISDKRVALERLEQKESELKIAAQDAEIARTAARGRSDAVRIHAQGEADAIVLKGTAQAKAQDEVAKTLTTNYLKFKAFDSESTRYYFVPVGKDGLPIIVGTDSTPAPRRMPPMASGASTFSSTAPLSVP